MTPVSSAPAEGRLKSAMIFAMATVALFAGGCLNPQNLNSVTGNLFQTAPGDEPYVAVRVINDSQATLELIPIVYDSGQNPPPSPYYLVALTPQAKDTGVVIPWPVISLAIGSLTQPLLPSIQATFPNGSTTTIPFGHPALQAGVDYVQGDTIVFRVVPAYQSQSYLTVSIGRIEGSAQTSTPREDTYGKLTAILNLYGF